MTAPKREERPPSQSTLLLEMANEAGLLFIHTPEHEPYVLTPVDTHVETLPLRGRGFGAWLRTRFYEETGKAANNQAVSDALGVLEQRALKGERVPVSVRIASEQDGAVYLDLGGPDWRVVEVTSTGWRVIHGAEAPVYFRRPAGLLPLPVPERGGSLEELRPFVNAGDDAGWRLLAGWLVAALRRCGPYPVLVLLGEHGSAKSTTARVLRRCIDHNKAELRAEPRSEDDLVLAATNGWVVTLDNVSSLQPWLSDGLCRVSTGGGLGKRRLYSDGDEALFDVARPMILNGIGDIVARPDLLDRSFLVTLPRIEEPQRRREAGFWRNFADAHPRILGALLDAVVVAIREEESTAAKIGPLPRMADATVWIEAAAPALGWEPGAFLAAYRGNRDDAHDLALESSPIAAAVMALVAKRVTGFEGTASELLEALTEYAPEAIVKSKLWPTNGKALSNALQRLAPTLRAVGVDVDQARSLDRSRRRLWLLMQKESRDLRPQRPYRPNVSESKGLRADASSDASSEAGLFASAGRPVADAKKPFGRTADANALALTARPVSLSDDTDAADANAGLLSAKGEWPAPEPLDPDLF